MGWLKLLTNIRFKYDLSLLWKSKMKNLFGLVLITSLLITHCTHSKINNSNFYGKKSEIELYQLINTEIKKLNAHELKECNCIKVFYRDLFEDPDDTVRYAFDRAVGDSAMSLAKGRNTVHVLAIGSGTLLHELTAVANILARGKNVNLYISDWAYIFYGDKSFKEKANYYGKNPQLIPEGWKDFYFWDYYKNKKESYLSFFKKYHTAIDKFKIILANLDRFYNTKTTISVLKPPMDKAVLLPKLDMIISIDSFIDIPNLMWNLFYRMKPGYRSIRFLALNKVKPLGGFWESSDPDEIEKYSTKPATIDIYDVTSRETSGSYQLVRKRGFFPNKGQLEKAPDFKKNPKQYPTQSPLDIIKMQS